MTIICFNADLQVYFPLEVPPESWTNNFLNNYPCLLRSQAGKPPGNQHFSHVKGERERVVISHKTNFLAALFSHFSNFSNNFFSSGSEGRGALVVTTFPSRSNTIKRGIPVIL